MQIIRVEDNVRESRVDGDKVNDLPKGLRVKTVMLLNRLKGVKRISIENKIQDALFELHDKNVTLKSFDSKTRKEFLETIELLIWYLGEHWYSMGPPGVIGGTVHCADCHYSEIAGSPGDCPSPSCPSHKKWRMVIGPSYVPPKEDPRFTEIKKQMEEIAKSGGVKRLPMRIIGPGGKNLPEDAGERIINTR